MALSRCKEHRPEGRVNNYINYVYPIGYPYTSSICGINQCNISGLIWLTEDEYRLYLNGQEIFEFANNTTKVKVINV